MTNPSNFLPLFLREHARADLDRLRASLAEMAERGFGAILAPQTADTAGWPATHLHEIDVLGVSATGETGEQAARNWLTVAQRIAAPEVAA